MQFLKWCILKRQWFLTLPVCTTGWSLICKHTGFSEISTKMLVIVSNISHNFESPNSLQQLQSSKTLASGLVHWVVNLLLDSKTLLDTTTALLVHAIFNFCHLPRPWDTLLWSPGLFSNWCATLSWLFRKIIYFCVIRNSFRWGLLVESIIFCTRDFV